MALCSVTVFFCQQNFNTKISIKYTPFQQKKIDINDKQI
jgi:hypothetical protein